MVPMQVAALGMLMSVGAAVAWAVTPALIKVGLKYLNDPVLFTGIRFVTSLALFTPVILLLGFSGDVFRPVIALMIVVSAVLGPGLGDIAYAYAIRELGTGLAVLISYQYILVAQLSAIALLGERKNIMVLTLTPIALFGVYLAVRDEGKRQGGRLSRAGVLFGAAAAVFWGMSVDAVSYVAKYSSVDPFTLAFVRSAVLAPVLLTVGFLRVRRRSGVGETMTRSRLLRGALFGMASGVVAYFIGFSLFVVAIRDIGVLVPTLATALTPVLTQFISAGTIGEALTRGRLAGSVIVGFALAMASLMP